MPPSEFKDATNRFVLKSSIALNVAILVLGVALYSAAATGHLHGDIELTGFEIGGGTAQYARREQQLAALNPADAKQNVTVASSQVHEVFDKAAKPAKEDSTPTPARKPATK